MTDQMPKHDMPGGDRSDFCPVCNQPYFLEDCTPGKCNSRGELEHERHMLMSRDQRWDVEVESTWDLADEDNER